MEKFEILEYNTNYRDKLKIYFKSIAHNTSDDYVDYCISQSEGDKPSIIVVDECDNIVGCHLFFNTRLMVKNEEKSIAWGHDTYLNQEYRRTAGLDFVLTIISKNTVGIGLSEIARKILDKLKRDIWMESVHSYFLLNIFFAFGLVKRILKSNLAPLKLDNIIESGKTFRLVKDACDIIIPNGGYWFKNMVDYDLIRDKNFLDYRFFNNKVFDYSVYEYHNDSGDSCYFVVRPILVRGIPTVSLVDYRFYGDSNQMACILSAVKKIAKKNHIGVVQTIGGIKEIDSFFNSVRCYKRSVECLMHKSLKAKPTDSISVTPADTDIDFNS